jgi:hypothetical protein
MPTARAALELASTVAVIVTAGVFLAIVWANSRSKPPAPARETYLVGEPLDVKSDIELAAGRITTVLFLKTTCKFCAESMDFYRRLSAVVDRGSIIVISEESKDSMREYLDAQRFHPDRIISMPRSSLKKVRGTPTLLLVGSNGVILDVRLGSVRETADQDEVIKMIVRHS